MSDWQDATEPVPLRRERDLSDVERARRLRALKRRHELGLSAHLPRDKDTVAAHWVDADFDEMGA